MALTPDKIESYDPTHLIETAEWIGRQHPRWDNHFINQQMDLIGMGWTGVNGEKTLADATQDVADTIPLIAEAATAQATAMAGYTSLMAARGLAQTALEAAKGTGYQVDSSFGVKDTLPPTPVTQQARQVLAQEHASNIANTVGNFQAEQHAVAQALRTHGKTLQGHVSMVDNHTDKGQPPGQQPVHPDPNQHQEPKKHGFGDVVDSFGKVAGGTLSVLGGTALTVGAIPEEIGSGGLLTPAIIAQGAGGLTLITGGAASVEKGLQELFDDQ
jgi:hypothetical protein